MQLKPDRPTSDPVVLLGPADSAVPGIPDHELLRKIGSGSYGDVWLGRNVVGTLRAVKVVWRRNFDSDRPYEREFTGIQRFEPISRTHEGLVDILQIGRDDAASYFYYVMELADDASMAGEPGSEPGGAPAGRQAGGVEAYVSRTLRVEIENRGWLPVEECLRHFITLVSGLAALHHRGLIHRDIKPSNIILVGGVPKLADIGLVTEAGESFSFVGTEGFIAPEGPGSRQADIYALGKVLYEAATGKDRLQFPSLPNLPASDRRKEELLEINAILLRACATDPQERYATAEEFRADLSLLLSGRSVKRLRLLERRLRWARQAGAVTGLVALLAVGGGFMAAYRARVEREHSGRLSAALERAGRAETTARDRLYEALAATALAEQRSGLADARFRSLAAVTGAAEIRPGAAELRDAAISALALPGLRELRRWERPPGVDVQCFSADLTKILLADTQGVIHVQSAGEGKELFSFGNPGNRVTSLFAIGRGSRWAVVSRQEKETEVWDFERGLMVTNLPGVHQCLVSGDDQWLVLNHGPRGITCMNLATRVCRDLELKQDFEILGGGRGAKAVIGSRIHTNIAVIDLSLGQVSQVISLPKGEASYSLEASLDGRFVAVNSTSGRLLTYDLNAPVLPWASVEPHTGLASYVRFHPDGDWCLTSSWDATTRIVGVSEGRPILLCRRGSLDLSFNAEGTRLGWRNRGEGSLSLNEVAGREVCRVLGEPPALYGAERGPWNCAFLSDGRLLATATYDGVGIYDTSLGRQLARLVSTNCFGVAFAGTNRLYAAGPKGVACWPLSWSGPSEVTLGPMRLLTGDFAWQVCASEQGQVVATGFKDFMFIDPDGTVRHSPHNSSSRGGIISRDGRWLATIIPAQSLRVWRVDPPEVRLELPAKAGVGAPAFHPDGDRVALSDADSIAVLEIPGGREIWRVPVSGVASSAAWSPDGRLIAAIRDGVICVLLDAADGRILARIEHPDARHYDAVVFSPDSTQLACVSLTHVLHLWNLAPLRRELAALHLDWDLPPAVPATSRGAPPVVHVIPSAAPGAWPPP